MTDNISLGTVFDEKKDGAAVRCQLETIRQYMLSATKWYTLSEIHKALGYPEASISANLRHLKKKQWGSYDLQKRRRDGVRVWEYFLGVPLVAPGEFIFE